MDLDKMNAVQVSAYAREKGIDVTGCKTKAEKIKKIMESDRAGTVNVEVMGLEVEISPDVFDDFDVIEDFGRMQDGDIFVFPKLVKILFGDDFNRIRKHLEGDDGRLTVTKATEFFTEVIKAVEAKN